MDSIYILGITNNNRQYVVSGAIKWYNKASCRRRTGHARRLANTWLRGTRMAIIQPSSAQLAFDLPATAPVTTKSEMWDNCPVCGKLFYARRKHHPNQIRRYCSSECFYQTRRLAWPSRACAVCGAVFFASPSAMPYRSCCSKACNKSIRSSRQLGAKNHNWQGGKTDANSALRNRPEYKAWRDSVYKRDNFTCQMCKRRGGGRRHPLNAHHIKPLSQYPELALVPANGVTLCESCHNSFKGSESQYEAMFFAITGGVDEK